MFRAETFASTPEMSPIYQNSLASGSLHRAKNGLKTGFTRECLSVKHRAALYCNPQKGHTTYCIAKGSSGTQFSVITKADILSVFLVGLDVFFVWAIHSILL